VAAPSETNDDSTFSNEGSVHTNGGRRIPRMGYLCPYSPECVEGLFCEVRIAPVRTGYKRPYDHPREIPCESITPPCGPAGYLAGPPAPETATLKAAPSGMRASSSL
jgi:hypothetical protein